MKKQEKTFNIRMPKELWIFMKRRALDEDISLSKLIVRTFRKMKLKSEKKELTKSDANV